MIISSNHPSFPLSPPHIYNRLTIIFGIIALISRNEYSRGGGKRVHLLYPLIRIKEKLERIFIYILFCLFVCRQKKFAIICTVIRKVGREREERGRGRKREEMRGRERKVESVGERGREGRRGVTKQETRRKRIKRGK